MNSFSSKFVNNHCRPSNTEPKKNWFKQVLDKAPEVFKPNKTTNNLVKRPVLGGRKFVNKKGMLYKVRSITL